MNQVACLVGFLIVVLAVIHNADCRPKKTGRLSVDETFFMPEFMKQKYKDRIITQKDRADDLISPWSEAADTAVKHPVVSASTKTCPWTYVVVFNPRRIPDTILEAVCSTPQCMARHLSNYTEPSIEDVERNHSPYSNTPSSNTLCREVKYYRWVKVKSRKILQGKVKLYKMLLPVTVACSCISVTNIPS